MQLNRDDAAKRHLAEAIMWGETYVEWDEACDRAETYFNWHGADACYGEACRYEDM